MKRNNETDATRVVPTAGRNSSGITVMNGSNRFFTLEDFGEYLSVPKSSDFGGLSESTRISTSANTFASIRIR
jgi:hypothetical protein